MTTTAAYPRYMHQPSGGPPPADYGAKDLWPSKAPNPAYTAFRDTYGKFLAGLNGESMGFNNTNADSDEIKDYANELDILAVADDVVGNGVFDPNGSVPTNYADQAIFGDHVSMPGYIVRDRFYEPSEVQDLTTGLPVMYVPSGAVAIDPAQREAYKQTLLWEVPPGMGPQGMFWDSLEQSTVVPREGAWPIGQLDERPPASPAKMFIMSGLAGAAIGLVVGLMWPKKR